MLRAVGMTRRQARRMIRHESVMTALIGAALGLPLGIALAALVTQCAVASTASRSRCRSRRSWSSRSSRSSRGSSRPCCPPPGLAAERARGAAVRVARLGGTAEPGAWGAAGFGKSGLDAARDRPGDDGHDVPRRRRGAATPRARLSRSCRSTFRARAGSSTTRRRSGVRARRRRGGACRRGRGRRRSRRDRDREPARDHGALGALDGPSGRTARSSGRTGGLPARCAELPRDLDPGADRPRPGSRISPRRSSSGCSRETGAAGRARLRHRRLLARLAADRRRSHVTDVSNASRTMLLGLESLEWDDELLGALRRCRARSCPRVVASSGRLAEADCSAPRCRSRGSPATSRRRSSARRASSPASVKATYGTGSFVLANAGSDARPAAEGVLRDGGVAARTARQPVYALEGSVFVAGAAIQWLRDGLGLLARRGGDARRWRGRSRETTASTSCRR